MRLLLSVLRGGQYSPRQHDHLQSRKLVVVFAHPNDLNCPTELGLTADKLDPWLRVLFESSDDFVTVFHPFTGPFRERTLHGYLRTERLLAASFMKVLLSPIWCSWRTLGSRGMLRARMWSSFLRQVNARLVIGIGLDQIMVEGAHHVGIQCVEVQHGLLGPSTIDMYWPPAGEADRKGPDLVMAWDRSYQSNIEAAGLTAITTGPALLAKDLLVNVDAQESLGDPLHRNWDLREASGDKVRKLLILLSWGQHGTLGVFDPIFESLIGELAGQLDASRFIFRLHPVVAAHHTKSVEVRTMLLERFPGCSIHSPRDFSFEHSCQGCYALLSRPTASIFDAAVLGVRSFVVGGFKPAEIPEDLIKYVSELNGDTSSMISSLVTDGANLVLEPYRPETESLSVIRDRIQELR